MDGTSKPSRTPAPYGQACTNCVRAKSRCMLRDEGVCERCTRLDKECIPTSSVRKKSSRKTAASKRTQLEDKLDDLVNLLRTQHATLDQTSPQLERSEDPQVYTPRSLDGSPQQSCADTPCDDQLTDGELVKFRKQHVKPFPFIYLSPDLSAEQLVVEKPVLSLAIKTLCNKALSRQVVLSKKLRETVAIKMVVDGEKSLDLLLSILLCMAWSIYFTAGKQYLGMLSSLARSLTSDLRLDKPDNPSLCPSIAPTSGAKVARTPESRRALLACFALSTIISTTFKYDTMPWLPQLEEDCNVLAANADYEGDGILVAIVRTSRICLRAAELSRYLGENPEQSRHVALHLGPLKTELDRYRSTISPDQAQHTTVTAYLFSAEVIITELALMQPPTLTQTPNLTIDYRRSDFLMACLAACRTCTEFYLSLDFLHISGSFKLLFGYCIKVIFKLATFQDPIWDTSVVRETVDILGLVERCAIGAERANTTLKEETGEDSVFSTAAKTLRDTAPQWKVPGHTVATGNLAVVEGWMGDGGMDMSMMDWSDNFWLHAPPMNL